MILNPNIHRPMIKLSNNSQLTNDAAVILSRLDAADQRKIIDWLKHAEGIQSVKPVRHRPYL